MSKGFYFTFLAATTWSIIIVLVRLILNRGENAFNLAFWVTICALPYWFSVAFKNRRAIKKLDRKNLGILVAMGLISTVGVGVTETLALKYSPAINYSFLIRTVLVFTIIFAYLFLGEKLTFKKILLVIIILFGSYLLTTNGQPISFSRGDIFTLIEAGLIAFGNNVLGKIATNNMKVDVSTAGSFLVGVIPISLIAVLSGGLAVPKTPILLIPLTVSAVLLVFFRFRAYKNAPASFVTMVFSFTPVFVTLLAVPILHESLSTLQFLGGIFIILAGLSAEKFGV